MTDVLTEKISKLVLGNMTDQDLLDAKDDIGRVLGRLQQQTQRLRSNGALIKNELKRRREGGREIGLPIISDHAVVRYLERHKGIDVPGIRTELQQIALRSKRERDEKRQAERLTDPETGITMVYTEPRNCIATILEDRDPAPPEAP